MAATRWDYLGIAADRTVFNSNTNKLLSLTEHYVQITYPRKQGIDVND